MTESFKPHLKHNLSYYQFLKKMCQNIFIFFGEKSKENLCIYDKEKQNLISSMW